MGHKTKTAASIGVAALVAANFLRGDSVSPQNQADSVTQPVAQSQKTFINTTSVFAPEHDTDTIIVRARVTPKLAAVEVKGALNDGICKSMLTSDGKQGSLNLDIYPNKTGQLPTELSVPFSFAIGNEVVLSVSIDGNSGVINATALNVDKGNSANLQADSPPGSKVFLGMLGHPTTHKPTMILVGSHDSDGAKPECRVTSPIGVQEGFVISEHTNSVPWKEPDGVLLNIYHRQSPLHSAPSE